MFQFSFFTELNPSEQSAFRKHLVYMLLEGVILGVLALNEFVFIKSLHGSNYQLGFLFQFSMVLFTFLVLINEFLKRVRNRKKLLRTVAWVTRLPLALIFFFPHSLQEIQMKPYFHFIFLGLFLLYFLGNIFIYPNINFLLKNNYRHKNFGKLYSYVTSMNKVVMLVITFVYGWLLDLNNFVFIYVFPVIAVLGVLSLYSLTSIPFPKNQIIVEKSGILVSAKKSISEMVNILKSNVPYRHFELGFMFYGFSFMISVTIITLFFYDALNLNYSSVAFYRNAYNILAIVLLPFFGKLLGKIDPRKFAAFTFGSMGMYIFFVMITNWFPANFKVFDITIYYTLLFYIFFHGIFAATMSLLWNIGSAYFCKPDEAGTYQSLHLSLTGIRGIAAPLLGIFFYEQFGFTVTFSLAVIFSLGAVGLMIWSAKKEGFNKPD
jgi:MFS family permease